METADYNKQGFRRVAIIDGVGEAATVALYWEHKDGRMVDIPWPESWPNWVSETWLRAHGYRVTVA